uniref:NADH-ubiquinone oxidoreductase chain 6 n=1 Tax=Hydrocolus stagnalis TaxID=1090898 RepID=A0A894JRT2_9DYTI|nr:NADH dehydrogenase subunit 6 [Hydrocolus stagnalis]QRV62683.1 NADH dehydrogenase subunit 6 [Hydrocolus stagnalis]
MYLIMIYLNLMLSLMFLFMNHPMSMGMILLIQTIIIALITGMYSYSFWFSYILFLIMIGGMLILFMYMTSLASNEKFDYSKNMIMLIMILSAISLILFIIYDSMFTNYIQKNSNMLETLNQLILNKNENSMSLYMLYNNPNYLINILMINYLLITLIAIVKITKSNMGPLRQKF